MLWCIGCFISAVLLHILLLIYIWKLFDFYWIHHEGDITSQKFCFFLWFCFDFHCSSIVVSECNMKVHGDFLLSVSVYFVLHSFLIFLFSFYLCFYFIVVYFWIAFCVLILAQFRINIYLFILVTWLMIFVSL